MASVKQGIKIKFRAKNNNAKYRLTYKTRVKESIYNNQLAYSYSRSVNLSYKD